MSYEVGAEDDFGTMFHQVLDGRYRATDSGVIGDVAVIIQWNVQIDPHKHPLPLQILLLQSAHAPLGRHDSPFPSTQRTKPTQSTPRSEPKQSKRSDVYYIGGYRTNEDRIETLRR